jgi:hypothetical protein
MVCPFLMDASLIILLTMLRGESGVYGFLSHLDSRDAATLLTQSIATEARQQMIFRQFSGAFPMPVFFETGISQAMSWSLLNRYIVECPAQNPRIEWPAFPQLSVVNDANLLVDGYNAAITHNRTSLTEAGRVIQLSWEAPGMTVSYNNSYNTTVGGNVNSTVPQVCHLLLVTTTCTDIISRSTLLSSTS